MAAKHPRQGGELQEKGNLNGGKAPSVREMMLRKEVGKRKEKTALL